MSEIVERLSVPYPMLRVSHRELETEWRGPVYVWDIDKTYLDTRFSQLKGLLKIPFEFGVDKQAIPGTVELIKGLRRGPSGRGFNPLFFVSASPRQLRKPIERKMLLDGVPFDGITWKDPLVPLLRGQVGQLKEQVAYKLSALLLLYRELPSGCDFHLFGDDAEADALVHALFADVCAGRLRGRALGAALRGAGVREEYGGHLVELVGALPRREAVAGSWIHLIRRPDGASLAHVDRRILGWPTAAAAARELERLNLITHEALEAVLETSPDSDLKRGDAPVTKAGTWYRV